MRKFFAPLFLGLAAGMCAAVYGPAPALAVTVLVWAGAWLAIDVILDRSK